MGAALTLADLNTTVNHEPRIQDERLANALGFPRLRKIKDLISRHIEALQRFGEVCTTMGQTSERGGRPGKTYWLNKKQALYLCTKSETANATEVTIQMVEVFDAYLKGETGAESGRSPQEDADRLFVSQAQERGFHLTFGPGNGAAAVHGPDGRDVAFRFGGRDSMAGMAAAIIRSWGQGGARIEDRLAAMEQQMKLLAASPFSRFTGRDAEVWVEPVRGDRMSPTLQHMRDFVIVRRAKGYEGEGVYLYRHDFGEPCISRVASAMNGKRELMLYGDNKHYGEHAVPGDWFAKHVVGIVIADVTVRDTRELSPLAREIAAH